MSLLHSTMYIMLSDSWVSTALAESIAFQEFTISGLKQIFVGLRSFSSKPIAKLANWQNEKLSAFRLK